MGQFDQLDKLVREVSSKKGAAPEASYTAQLLSKGIEKCAKKFGEEAIELALAAVQRKHAETIAEAADVFYHLVVLLEASGVSPGDVMAELTRREGNSGIAEKAARKNA